MDGTGDRGDLVQLGQVTYVPVSDRLIDPHGRDISLRAQSLQVLRHLANKNGTLVSRDDLISTVWADVAVTDDSLTQCIKDIRQALGDSGKSILKTVPKRGYMLQGDVQPSWGTAQTAPGFAQPQTPVTNRAIVPQLDPRDMLPTLVVVPFISKGGQDADVFGTFFASEIAKALSALDDVNVISQLSTRTLGQNDLSHEVLGQKLNADFALTGFVMAHGTQIVVSLEFAEIESGFMLWSDRVQTTFDPLATETEGVEMIVAHIQRAIMLNEVRRVGAQHLRDLKLFSILHGAVGLMHRFVPRDFQMARVLLEHVIEQAPNHPTPLAWKARWHVLNSVQGWTDARTGSETALELTAMALDLDPQHTHALVCEGQALVHLARRLDAAEDRYSAALASNPNDANGRALRGMLRSFTDRGDEGKRDTERALHLTPLDPHRFFFLALAAGSCIAVGDYDRAVTLAKESLRLNRTHVSTMRMLAVAQLGAGDGDGGRRTAAELMDMQPGLRVSSWLKSSPSADYANGAQFATMLRDLGIPD
ncbi:winged helix-turn-helix domain-containing tetratricopeptide repeat protein [Tateyamaria sp. syn59]|uniref:winged helix-turn-helix domain-containing tetratricopeptide repeat protein n=1 Tax=Tateyamaria sp. syn59 TaxID=2576942 RepID=UPI00167B95B6|nr:winged helix-turn-helix domain-containing protein [Tateyamaria sp. syn59]